jgi:hypothetical protein
LDDVEVARVAIRYARIRRRRDDLLEVGIGFARELGLVRGKPSGIARARHREVQGFRWRCFPRKFSNIFAGSRDVIAYFHAHFLELRSSAECGRHTRITSNLRARRR